LLALARRLSNNRWFDLRLAVDVSEEQDSAMFARFLATQHTTAYKILRIAIGILFAFHGLQVVFGVLAPAAQPIGSQLWVGGLIELVTGLMVAANLGTIWAALLASGTMAVAYIQFHWKFAFDSKFFPAINQGEPALVYSLIFLYIAFQDAVRRQAP
jgi:putative oxidoreductase